jgi:hypothetical protein
MRSLKAVCGLAAMALLLSACGGGSGSTPSASASTSPNSTVSNGNPTSTTSSSTSGSGSSGSGSSGSGSSGSGSSQSTGSATLAWSAPKTNSDGTALTDLAGFHIHYGTSAGSLTTVIDIANASAVSYTVTELSAGTWYFAVSAYTTSGVESSLSNVGSKTIS